MIAGGHDGRNRRHARTRVLFATPECAPWAKTGGLGDVSAALPEALAQLGLDIVVLLPGYESVRDAARGARKVADLRAEHGLPAARLLRSRLPSGVQALILDCPSLYRRDGGPYQDGEGADYDDNALRFGLLSRVAARLASDAGPLAWRADILHCNDWPTALAAGYLKLGFPGAAKSLVTVHNLAFQGNVPLGFAIPLGLPLESLQPEGAEFWGKLSFLKAGLYYADRIVAVSPTYAREIRTSDAGCGMEGLLERRAERLAGILNGIDTRIWDPRCDPYLHVGYDLDTLDDKAANRRALQAEVGLDADERALLLGIVSRLTDQKGIDLVLDALPDLLARPLQLVVLGNGDAALEEALRRAAAAVPGRLAVMIGFDEALAHRIEGGADAFLMPSRFEPCGLNQMYSQHYGTPPIVRATGGLVDSVTDFDIDGLHRGESTGFLFRDATPAALVGAIDRALGVFDDPVAWRTLCRNGMARDFSWAGSACRYARLYAAMREAAAA